LQKDEVMTDNLIHGVNPLVIAKIEGNLGRPAHWSDRARRRAHLRNYKNHSAVRAFIKNWFVPGPMPFSGGYRKACLIITGADNRELARIYFKSNEAAQNAYTAATEKLNNYLESIKIGEKI
jgi:hypothetical protein